MIRRTAGLAALVCTLMFAGCRTTTEINDLVPADGSVDPADVATLVVAYPLKPDGFNGRPVEHVGWSNTIFRTIPGDVELEFHMDTADHWSDTVPVAGASVASGPNTTTTTYYYAETLESSGLMTDAFTTVPGHVHFYRIVMKDGSRFWTGLTHGPNPFVAENGRRISFDPEGNVVRVESGSGTVEYGLNDKLVYFSDDGRHVAFFASDRKGWLAVVDGMESPRFDALHASARAWSPDGAHFAYAVYINRSLTASDLYLVVDGERIGPYDSVDPGSPIFFDPDGRLVAVVKIGEVWHVKWGEEEKAMASEAEASEAAWTILGMLSAAG